MKRRKAVCIHWTDTARRLRLPRTRREKHTVVSTKFDLSFQLANDGLAEAALPIVDRCPDSLQFGSGGIELTKRTTGDRQTVVGEHQKRTLR